MHITRLTVKRFVLQARRWFGGCGQFAFDSRPGERLDGAHAGPGLEHRLVLRTCRSKQEAAWSVRERLEDRRDQRACYLLSGLGNMRAGVKRSTCKFSLIKEENSAKVSCIFDLSCVCLNWRDELGLKNSSNLDHQNQFLTLLTNSFFPYFLMNGNCSLLNALLYFRHIQNFRIQSHPTAYFYTYRWNANEAIPSLCKPANSWTHAPKPSTDFSFCERKWNILAVTKGSCRDAGRRKGFQTLILIKNVLAMKGSRTLCWTSMMSVSSHGTLSVPGYLWSSDGCSSGRLQWGFFF